VTSARPVTVRPWSVAGLVLSAAAAIALIAHAFRIDSPLFWIPIVIAFGVTGAFAAIVVADLSPPEPPVAVPPLPPVPRRYVLTAMGLGLATGAAGALAWLDARRATTWLALGGVATAGSAVAHGRIAVLQRRATRRGALWLGAAAGAVGTFSIGLAVGVFSSWRLPLPSDRFVTGQTFLALGYLGHGLAQLLTPTPGTRRRNAAVTIALAAACAGFGIAALLLERR
jgi:hypothetical protein